MTRRREPLVHYVSPFGSPAWMSRTEAETHLARDDRLWLRLQALGGLSPRERQIGSPRIERTKP